MTTRNFVWTCGTLAGAAGIGAATALLYAPQSGKKTRRQIRKFANHQMDNLHEMKTEFGSYIDDHMDGAKRVMTNCLESAQCSLERSRTAVESSITGIRSLLRQETRQ